MGISQLSSSGLGNGTQVCCFSTETQLRARENMSALCLCCSIEMPKTHLGQLTDLRAETLRQQGVGLGITVTQQLRHDKGLYFIDAQAPDALTQLAIDMQ